MGLVKVAFVSKGVVCIDQERLFIGLVGDHVHRDLAQDLVTHGPQALQVVDLLQTGDEEDAQLVVVVTLDVLLQVALEDVVTGD